LHCIPSAFSVCRPTPLRGGPQASPGPSGRGRREAGDPPLATPHRIPETGPPTCTHHTQLQQPQKHLQPPSTWGGPTWTGDHSAEIAASWWVEVRETSKGQVQTTLSCLRASHAARERRAGGGLSAFIGHR